MHIERTYTKTIIELFGIEKDIDLVRSGWKEGQIIEADREIINGRDTRKCHVELEGGKKTTFHIGFNCRRIPNKQKIDTKITYWITE